MPNFESCNIFGNLLAGGFIMAEFQAYKTTEIVFVFIGCSLAVFGILYKVSMLDEEDIEKSLIEEKKESEGNSEKSEETQYVDGKPVKVLVYENVIKYIKSKTTSDEPPNENE
jgi:hypothetical protein